MESESDQLHVKVNYETTISLKVIVSIYYLYGFLAPLILPEKLFLQDLWKEKVK